MALHRFAWNGVRKVNCSVLGRHGHVIPQSLNSSGIILGRGLSTGEPEPFKPLSVEEIIGLPSNRATRYVYMRTLPLSTQSEYSVPGDDTIVEEVVNTIEAQVKRVVAKHADSKVVDLRSAVHLHTAALALATYRVCTPTLGGERSVELIRRAFGIGQSLPAHWITKAALMFTPNRLNAAKRMMANTVQDFGEAFDARIEESGEEDTVRLIINKCFYKRLFAEEDAPHLTRLFCEMDTALFKPISAKAHGLQFALESTLMDDDSDRCNFVINRCKARASNSSQ